MTMQASIHGRLGRDPKEIQTQSGTAMTTASIAVTIPASKADAKPTTLWFNIVTFGKLAELLLRHQSGEMLNVAGTVQVSRWADQSGETREQLQIIADSIISARSTRPSGGKRQSQASQAQNCKPSQANRSGYDERNPPADFNDDLNF